MNETKNVSKRTRNPIFFRKDGGWKSVSTDCIVCMEACAYKCIFYMDDGTVKEVEMPLVTALAKTQEWATTFLRVHRSYAVNIEHIDMIYNDSVIMQNGNQFRYKLYAIHKEPFEKTLANVSLVADELSIYEFHKSFIFKRFPVIHVTWCYHKIEQFSLLIAYQVKLESKEPAHGAFAPLCDTLIRNIDSVMFHRHKKTGEKPPVSSVKDRYEPIAKQQCRIFVA